MTLVLILILVALWIVVLAPAFIKRHVEQRSTGSIDSFHRSLHLLERTGPKLVAPAYRLGTAQAATGTAPGQSGLPAVASTPGRANLILLKPVGDDAGGAEGSTGGSAASPSDQVVDEVSGQHYLRVTPLAPPATATASGVPSLASQTGQYRVEQARRRRRDVLLGLVCIVTFTALLGLVRSLHPLWVLTVLAGVALVAYVGLAAYAQALGRGQQPAGAGRRVARLATGAADLSAAVRGFPGAWDPVEDQLAIDPASADAYWAATAGFPGAWDEYEGYQGYEAEPRRAASG